MSDRHENEKITKSTMNVICQARDSSGTSGDAMRCHAAT